MMVVSGCECFQCTNPKEIWFHAIVDVARGILAALNVASTPIALMWFESFSLGLLAIAHVAFHWRAGCEHAQEVYEELASGKEKGSRHRIPVPSERRELIKRAFHRTQFCGLFLTAAAIWGFVFVAQDVVNGLAFACTCISIVHIIVHLISMIPHKLRW